MSELTVPYLRGGIGTTPADGGCIMQVIDWLQRNEWTDNPPGVHPLLRAIAIATNDGAPEDERQKLLDLAPRLMHTADTGLSLALADYVVDYVNNTVPGLRFIRVDDYGAAENAQLAIAQLNNALRRCHAGDWNYLGTLGMYAWAALNYLGHAPLALLSAVLDEYDRLSERKEVEQIDFAPVCKAMELV